MSDDPAAFWDQKYAIDDYYYGKSANAWLQSQAGRLRAGMRALSVADGEGRNGVWLAEQGLDVTAVDASAKAIAKARALAAERGVSLRHIQADLTHWSWPVAGFDLAVAIFAHFTPDQRPTIHRHMLEALAPSGLVLIEAYSPYQHLHRTGGPPDLDMLYTAFRLQQDFHGAEILELAEVTTELQEGRGHHGISATVRLVARRPT
jgi:cyclopropane fatty-acyl-phospholipid synthase-like methyltransferase